MFQEGSLRTAQIVSLSISCQAKATNMVKVRRFLMSDNKPDCIVKVIHDYLSEAQLNKGQPLFKTDRFIVTDVNPNETFRLSADVLGLPSANLSTHSLRVGGLATHVR
jgi:hypothetical protein